MVCSAMDGLDDDLERLALAILRKLGVVERQMEIVSHLLSFIRGEYGSEEDWNGTINAEVALHKRGVLAFPFKLFNDEQRDCLANWCPAGVLEIECSNLNAITCCINVVIPCNPSIPSSDVIDIEIVFEVRGDTDGMYISERTNTDANEQRIKMALLAHLMA